MFPEVSQLLFSTAPCWNTYCARGDASLSTSAVSDSYDSFIVLQSAIRAAVSVNKGMFVPRLVVMDVIEVIGQHRVQRLHCVATATVP